MIDDAALPALFRAFDNAARAEQAQYMRSQKFLLWLLVLISVVAAVGQVAPAVTTHHHPVEVGSALAGFVLLALSLWFTARAQAQTRLESWYDARALAESAKSMAWKYMMRAEPYVGANADDALAQDLKKILTDAKASPGPDQGDQITAAMRELRAGATDARLAVYRRDRIADQRAWYARRSDDHKQLHARWHRGSVLTLVVALVLSGTAVVVPELGAAVGVATAIAPCMIAWGQTQRSRELAHTYAFTSHEIGLVDAGRMPTDDDQMARFVADCETVFSREHTMWRARRETTDG